MSSISYLNAAVTCQKTTTAGDVTGFVILAAVIGGIVALVIANSSARSRLTAANAELAFLRPENARLQQWLAAASGAPVHEAYSTGYTTAPTGYTTASAPPAQWHPDPTGRHQVRLWDGVQWSDQVSDDGVVSTDQIGA
jgi:Protein of unknown function (DUF2510)